MLIIGNTKLEEEGDILIDDKTNRKITIPVAMISFSDAN